MGKRGWLLVLAAMALATACRRTAPPPPLVNQDFRFQLAWPGKGWSLLDAVGVRAIVPDAVAGAGGGRGVHGAVIVERAELTDLEAAAKQLAQHADVRDRQTSPFTRLQFAGQPAVRWGTTGTVNGLKVRLEHTVFAYQKHLYQVLVHAAGDLVDGKDFRLFTDAFTLLPGEVRAGAQSVPVADATGVGWRVRGGVYESAAHGVRAAPRPGWRVSVGQELARMNAAAEFGLSRTSPPAFIVVLADRVPHQAERAAYTRDVVARAARLVGGTVAPQPTTVTVSGVPVTMTEYTTAGPLPLRYLHGVLVHGRAAFQLVGWTTAEQGEAGLAAIADGLGAIELLDREARAGLRQQLEGRFDPRSQVGPGYSFRRDIYRDFGRRFSFHRSGLWRVTTGDRARERHEAAVLWLDEPSLGVQAFVSVTPTQADAATAHHLEVAARLLAPGLPVAARLGGVPAMRSAGQVHSQGVKLQWEVITTVREGRVYGVNLWGLPPDLEAAGGEIDRMLAAFQFAGPHLEAPGSREGRYLDQRLGFSYQPPAGDWRSKDMTPAGAAGDMQLVGWTRTGREIIVGAMGINDQAPGVALQGMEARMRAVIGDPVERHPGSLGGQRCQKARGRKGLHRMELCVLERDGIAYLLIASAPFIGPGTFFEEAAAGFAFLD